MEGKSYRLRRCEGGSAKYGNCERCGAIVDTTYMLTTMRRYWSNIKKAESLTSSGCQSLVFGHKRCLSELTNA